MLRKDQPDDPDLLFNLGNSYFLLGDYDQAIACYGEALEQAPGDRRTLINRAACYRLGRPRRHGLAMADLDRVYSSNRS